MRRKWISGISVVMVLIVGFSSQNSIACWDSSPIAWISSPWQVRIAVGQWGSFDAYYNSYDPDDGTPYGYGNGISGWSWTFDVEPYGLSGENSSAVSFLYNSPGKYKATIQVVDDDAGKTDSDYGDIYVYKAELKSIEFTSDHGLLKKNPTGTGVSVWDDSSNYYESPEWIANSRNNPITHTKNTKISATVKVKVEPSGTSFDLIGDGSDGYVDFQKTGLTSTGADQDITVTADTSLPDEVGTLNKTISWKIKVGSWECAMSSSGAHKIYVTYGTPAGSDVTERRVQEVCTSAVTKSSLDACAAAIFNELDNSFELGAITPDPIWLLHDPDQYSECPGLAYFVNQHFRMLGLGTGDLKYCHACPDGTYEASDSGDTIYREIIPGAEHPNPTTHDDDHPYEYLIHWDGSNPPGPNAFEATCLFNSKYYALGVDFYNTAKEVVKGAFDDDISWEYQVLVDPGPPPIYEFYTCTEAPWVEAP